MGKSRKIKIEEPIEIDNLGLKALLAHKLVKQSMKTPIAEFVTLLPVFMRALVRKDFERAEELMKQLKRLNVPQEMKSVLKKMRNVHTPRLPEVYWGQEGNPAMLIRIEN